MKKLLSAVTSFVMGATLMTSAFASPVSAAGGSSTVQPTVSIGEVSDVSANKNASNANLIIDFGEYTAKPGDKVVVKPTIKNNGGQYAVAGVDVDFAVDSPLTITAIGGTSAAFGGAGVQSNLAQYKASITPLNGNGDPTVPTDGEALFQLMVQIPDNAAGGTYEIGFGSKVDLFKEGASSDEWTYQEITGKITVEGSGNNDNTTTTTTTITPPGNANLIIDFGNYEAKAGDKVVVKPTIKNNGGEYPLAGVDVEFAIDSPLTITAIGGTSAAFGGAGVQSNLAQYKASITPLDGNGDPTVAIDGEALFQLMVQIPANCADGTYEIGFGNKVDLFKEGASSDEWSYREIKGIITVGEGGTTTSKTTTTTTTTKPVPGNANLIIDFGNYEAKAGDKVVVKPTIKNNGGEYPLAGVDVEFAIDSPLTITAIGGTSAAFGGAGVQSNLAQYKASITPLDGNGDPTVAIDGEALFQLMVQIPANCADGTYEIGFGNKVDLFKEGASSDEWSYQEIKGIITVGNVNPPSDASVVIDFGKYSAKAGETIEVAPTIKSVNGECAIGGVDVQLAIDNPLEITAIGGTSPAFGGASVNTNILDLYASVITLDATGEPSVPTDGEALFKIKVDIPAGTPAGTYEIGFGNRVEIFKQGKNSDMWPYEEIKGTITVYGDSTTSTTTTTTTTVPPVAGSVEWVIPTVNALPGETVTMDVVVKNSDIEVAGAQFDINAKSPIDYSASSGSTAYDSTLVANGATKQFAFGQGIGKGIKAENGSTVLTLTYKVPADCAAGSYPVEWSNAFISDTNGNDITNKVTLTDGAIIVGVTGEVSWVLDNVTAKPGDEVTLKAVISDPKATKLPIAGAQFNINAKAPIVYSAIAGSDAYGATIVNNDAIKAFAFAEGVGAGVASEDGKVVLTITYKVPADCPAGVYPVEWSNAFISDTNGGSLTDKVSLINGSITVEDEETEGDVTWNIPEVEAMPGQTVTMNVLVEGSSNPGLPVAGAQFSINADAPIVYESIAGSEAYDATIVANNADKKFAFAEGIGSGVAAADGDVVLVLTYTVPEDCAEGEYPVKWSNAFISDTNGKDITGKVNLDDGAIIVKKTTTTTTVTTSDTTTSSDDSTTVSTTVTTTVSTTDTTSTSSGTTTTLPEGAVLWKIDTVEAQPGETVTLNMVVLDPNGTKLPIAGAQFDINADAPIVYGGVTEKSDAYGAAIVVNPATKEFAFADSVGAGVPSEDGKYVLTLTYTVPEDCAAGTYPVKISELFASSTDGANITNYVLTENGAIIVKVPTTTSTVSTSTVTTTSGSTTTTTSGSTTSTTSGSTTTTTSGSTTSTTSGSTTTTTSGSTTTTTSGSTTTTTSGSTTSTTSGSTTTTTSGSTTTTTSGSTTSTTSGSTTTTTSTITSTTTSTTSTTLPKGAILWKIDTVEAKPGETVTLNMVVVDSNGTKLPISAAQFNINADSPIKYVGVSEISDAYGAAIVANAVTNEFAFADKDGNAIPSEDGKYVLTLTYTVPEDCAAGTYPVKISELFASTVDGAEITDRVLTENGAIIVKVPTTTSTVTTSTVTTTSEGSTTTESTTSGSTTSTTSGSTTTTTSGSTTSTTSGSTTTTTSGSTTTTTSGSTTTTTSGSTTTTTSGSTTTTTSGSTTTTTSGSTTTTTSGSTTSTTSGSTTSTTSGSTTTESTSSSTSTTTVTTTSSTTSSTTTSNVAPEGGVIWQVGQVKAKQGDTVKVPVKLYDFNDSKLPVSGAQFTIDFDTDKFELVGASDKSGAYLADIVYNPETGQYAFANGTGNSVIGTHLSDVIVLEFKVKEDCPNGEYDIAIDNLFVSDANGGDITELVLALDGSIIVDGTSDPHPWTGDTFAVVEKTHGFYFSHDNGTRNNGEKGGFNPNQITSIKIYDRITEENGDVTISEWDAAYIDMSKVNFGEAVPSTVYNEENTTFKYEVPVFYGNNPMVDQDGNAITVTVYIGVKGDIDLNNKVLANDAAQALAFYTASQDIGADPAAIKISESEYVTSATDVLDDFCAFLGDVDANEWSEGNWKLTKADRKILANDAGAILTFYSESQTPGAEAQPLWDMIVPERFGE